MNHAECKDIVDALYCDFDWYRGEWDKKEEKRFMLLIKDLVQAFNEK